MFNVFKLCFNYGNTISIQKLTCLRALFLMSFMPVIRLKLFNLHSGGNYYRKEFLLMTIFEIAKTTLSKKSSSNSCIVKKINIRHMTVLKVWKRSLNIVKFQINYNKAENTTLHQASRTRIRLMNECSSLSSLKKMDALMTTS